MTTRKEFLKTAGLLGMAGIVSPVIAGTVKEERPSASSSWADGARLVVSVYTIYFTV